MSDNSNNNNSQREEQSIPESVVIPQPTRMDELLKTVIRPSGIAMDEDSLVSLGVKV